MYTFVKNASGFQGDARVYRDGSGNHIVISRCNTFDHGDETMIFPWSTVTNDVSNWNELYAGYGETHEEALASFVG